MQNGDPWYIFLLLSAAHTHDRCLHDIAVIPCKIFVVKRSMAICFSSLAASFNFYILMDFPIHIDTISTELSILYFKELPVKLFYKMMYTVWL